MPSDPVYFFTTNGFHVTEAIRRAFLRAAIAMVKRSQGKLRLVMTEAEITVSTSFQPARIGSFSGVGFSAVVESESGTKLLRYLVEDAVLRLSPEAEIIPIEMDEGRSQAAQWN